MGRQAYSILIVDDNAAFALRLKYMLEQSLQDDQIEVVYNYFDALERIVLNTPHLILLDVRLGEKSGIDLLRIIQEKKLPGKVIMISNQLSEGYREECKKLGATLFLDKMKDLETLPDILKFLN